MKKSIILMVLVFNIVLASQAQTVQPPALSKTVNNTILQQMLSKFNHKISLELFTPGFFFVDNYQNAGNAHFNEFDYNEETETPYSDDFYQKIISDNVNNALLRYIPKDSIMKVRVIVKNKLIFEMAFQHDKDTLLFNLTNRKKDRNKSISYYDNKVISSSYNNTRKSIMYSSRLYGDTLRKSELWDEPNRTRTQMIYTNGYLARISYFDVLSGNKETLKKTTRFFYGENKRPDEKQYLNEKGEIKKTIEYLYKGDTLVQLLIKEGQYPLLTTTKDYSSPDYSLITTYHRLNLNYTKIYYLNEKNERILEIENTGVPHKRRYTYKTDINNRLAEFEYDRVTPDLLTVKAQKKWVLSYNAQGNLSSIKVINKKGKIIKSVIFEYSFMKP